jgi:hypothetical protein
MRNLSHSHVHDPRPKEPTRPRSEARRFDSNQTKPCRALSKRNNSQLTRSLRRSIQNPSSAWHGACTTSTRRERDRGCRAGAKSIESRAAPENFPIPRPTRCRWRSAQHRRIRANPRWPRSSLAESRVEPESLDAGKDRRSAAAFGYRVQSHSKSKLTPASQFHRSPAYRSIP